MDDVTRVLILSYLWDQDASDLVLIRVKFGDRSTYAAFRPFIVQYHVRVISNALDAAPFVPARTLHVENGVKGNR